MDTALKEGLEGVVVARTKLSHVDGEAGRLIIAGDDVEALAGAVTFEQLWERVLGPADFGAARALAARESVALADGMDALRATVAAMASEDPVTVAAAVAVSAAAWSRRRRGLAPIAPDPKLGHAADLLRMVTGE